MIYIQLISSSGENLQVLLKKAILEQKIKSFETVQVKGGFKIVHKKYQGTIKFTTTKGPLIAELSSKRSENEWQLLEAFVGRLAYHFQAQIAAVNIQFQS